MESKRLSFYQYNNQRRFYEETSFVIWFLFLILLYIPQQIIVSQMKIYEEKDRKFKPQSKPFKQNSFTSVYKVFDQSNNIFYAKFFYEAKVRQLNMFQATQYNQTVLSDLSDQIYPQHFLNIQYTYSTPEGFIFVTEPYEITLDQYMKSKVIEEVEALQIFQQCMKAVYSLYMAGFWHRNIRPEHFVKVKKIWKLESIVYSESFEGTQGIKSEYLWDPQYQPPQAYEKIEFTQKQLDNLIVWNMGSLLVDILLSYHKLKDKTILDKFKDSQFSWKAIGIKKKFTKVVSDILGKMLHYDQNQRMKLTEFFSNENLSKQVANHYKNSQKKERIYVSGQSYLAKASIEDRSQSSLLVPNFKQEKEEIVQKKSSIIVKKNSEKIQTNKEIYDTIKNIAKQDLQTIQENVYEQSSMGGSRNRLFQELANNPKLSKALEIYKCHYDKCQLMQISSNKLDRLQEQLNVTKQMLLLNKYAILFVSQLHLNLITQAMNRNVNVFQLDPQVWSEFQSSMQFKGFKEILNFRYYSRKITLNELKQQIVKLADNQKELIKRQDIHKFVFQDDKTKDFQQIKLAYRKIVKSIYDIVSSQYNKTKSQEMARLGMYITYCMTIDKLYIADDIPDNFAEFFTWINQAPTSYISLQEFQEYLDNADKLRLLGHSSYVLKKYFQMSDFGQSRARI